MGNTQKIWYIFPSPLRRVLRTKQISFSFRTNLVFSQKSRQSTSTQAGLDNASAGLLARRVPLSKEELGERNEKILALFSSLRKRG